MEKTLVILKPDAVERKLCGEIISRIERKGFTIESIKSLGLTEELLKSHYGHLADKPFFPEIVDFMTRTPVMILIISGNAVVDQMRKFIGATNPEDAQMGTIRGDFANTISENLIHASDSVESAQEEIKRFFG